MARAAVEHSRVQVGAGVIDEAAEEILHQLGLQIADQTHPHQVLVHQRRTASQIERDHGQGLIHGQHEIAGAVDSAAIAQGLGEQLPQHDADVFHGVVLVHVQVAGGFELQVEAAVPGEQLQHVIEEADAGRDAVLSAAFNFELAGDLRLLGITLHDGGSHRASASSSWLISSRTARAPSSLSSAQSSSRRALAGAAMPMKGTPAALALRASSTVSPMYQSWAWGAILPMCNNPSGAGL